jgi:hypothetical protein
MKINFTKKEYQLLVTMIEIADWVLTANDDTEKQETKPYNEIRKKILSHFKEMDMEDCYQEDDGDYYETLEYEQTAKSTQFIEQYNEDFFWEELINKLVERDFYQKFGDQEVDMETRIAEITAFEEIYVNEINQNGLENVMILFKEKSKVH